jgi:hypothetical protein
MWFRDMGCYKGASPKELAPEQFKVARYKLRSVETELKNSNWIKNLKEVSSESHLEEFILLFMALAPQSLSNHSGKITWKWTTHGQYSAASTYECQFLGSMSAFSDINLWKAVAEQKMKFFAWLVFHDRVLTTDNMAKRGWECNPMCSFCYCQFETTTHLLCHCNYAEVVWNLVAVRFSLPIYSDIYSGSSLAD